MKTFSIPGIRLARSSFVRRVARENTLDSLNAEVWAREALLALQSDLVLGNIVYRDYSDQVARFGDVVNVPRIGTFQGKRKGALCEEVIVQDATADSFQVALDQFLYVTFKICDGEENRPIRDLIDLYATPAMRALVEMVDLCIGGQHVNFWNNSAGHLQGMTPENSIDYVLDLREVLTLNKNPLAGRQLMLGVRAETPFLRDDTLRQVNTSGSTRTLRNGEIGQLYGFDIFSAGTTPYVRPGQATTTALVNNATGYGAGATVITVDSVSAGTLAGKFVVIAGDDTPQRVVATTVATGAGDITISPGLRYAVPNNAAIISVNGGLVNKSTGYAGTTFSPRRRVGYAKHIRADGFGTVIPQVSQPVAFGTGSDLNIYTIIEVRNVDDNNVALGAGEYDLLLDRPLVTALINDETVNLGPAGGYNFSFMENSLAAAFRPLPKPRTGALSAVVSDNGLPIRTTITYDGKQQAHLVTFDMLMGLGIYDENRAAVLFS